MTNLKQAFQMQNIFKTFQGECLSILGYVNNIITTTTVNLTSTIDPNIPDTFITATHPSEYADRIDGIIKFSKWILDEQTKIGNAIEAAKESMNINFDLEINLNTNRRKILTILRRMSSIKESSERISDRGCGYKFDTDGKQQKFVCDAIVEKKPNFDKDLVKNYIKYLTDEANAISNNLDMALIGTNVDYDIPFDSIDISFNEAFEFFIENINI